MKENLQNLQGDPLKKALFHSRVAVLGMERSGISATQLLLKLGAKVFASDIHPKRETPSFISSHPNFSMERGFHSNKILEKDAIILSPGVPWDHSLLKKARLKRIPVWSELELGFRLNRIPTIVAVTGTNGKTTTTSLLGTIFQYSGKKTFIGGNIGNPFCEAAQTGNNFEVAVLEVSSYQLEGILRFHPQVALLLNLTPDHLKHHKTMARYSNSKKRIFMNQDSKDVAILNWDDPWCRKLGAGLNGKLFWISTHSYLRKGIFWNSKINQICLRPSSGKTLHFSPPKHIPGLHNIENSSAAIAAAWSLRIPKSIIQKSLDTFPGVEHRLEKVRTIRGLTYINDSKATNVDSTLKALDSYSEPLWLILGGEDKGSSYKPIRDKIQNLVTIRGIFLIGEASQKIQSDLNGICEMIECQSLSHAVQESYRRGNPGDLVLLSPACASFDQFKNFEDRGHQFKELVKKLH